MLDEIGNDAGRAGAPRAWVRRSGAARDGLLLLTFAFGGMTAVFDKMTQVPREAVLFWAVLALAVLDAEGGRDSLRQRRAFAGAAFAASSVFGAIVCHFAERKRITVPDTLRDYLVGGVWAQWLAAMWIYSPMGLELGRRWRGRRASSAAVSEAASGLGSAGPRWSGFMHVQAALLLAFGFWSLLTCFSSTAPARSFLYYSSEAGLYVPFFLLWMRVAGGRESLQAAAKRLGFAALVLGTLAGSAVALIYLGGGEGARRTLTTLPVFDSTPIEPDGAAAGVWRLMFPFGHHNRMAYFSLLCLLLVPLAWTGGGRPSRARLAATIALLALALANLQWTLNRGAMLALGVALGAQVLLAVRRRAVAAAAFAAAAGVLALGPARDRMATLLEPATYNNADSTVNLRFQHWRVALEMIDRNHSLGIGYGWKHVEKNYWDIATRRGWPVNEKVHAHNVWLEIGAESGLPAVALFTFWQLSRCAWLGALWRRRAALGSDAGFVLMLWIGVEIAIFIYSLGNLPTRRSLGVITFGVWSLMAADLVRLESRLRLGSAGAPNLPEPREPAELGFESGAEPAPAEVSA